MSQQTRKTSELKGDASPLDAEMQELKKDMQQAKIEAWVKQHQQGLMMGVAVLVLGMFAVGLWSEHQRKTKESAAMVYYQGIAIQDKDKQKALLNQVIQDYGDTAYADLAHLRLAAIDEPEQHLRALMNDGDETPEFRWQAELDLAEYLIEQKKQDAARQVLATPVGAAYQQYYYFLLSEVSQGAAKKDALQQALNAESHDEILKERITSMLAAMH